MSDEGKTENEIFNYSVSRGEQMSSSNKWKRTAQIDNWVMSEQWCGSKTSVMSQRKLEQTEIQYIVQIVHSSGLKNFVELQIIENYHPHRNLN